MLISNLHSSILICCGRDVNQSEWGMEGCRGVHRSIKRCGGVQRGMEGHRGAQRVQRDMERVWRM